MPDIIYPYKQFRYKVECNGLTKAGFSEVSAPDAALEVVKYREGDYLTPESIKMPGLIEYTNVTLKNGITDSMDFYQWISNISAGIIERQDLTIILLDDTGAEKCTWVLGNAWPCKYKAPDFNASGNEVAIEELELCYETMKRTK